jgi:hypothetical protein
MNLFTILYTDGTQTTRDFNTELEAALWASARADERGVEPVENEQVDPCDFYIP